MGYRVSWISRSGSSTGELLDFSGRVLSGKSSEFPDLGWYLLNLPRKNEPPWVLLIASGSEHFAELNASQAQALSKGDHETLYFWCSDTVMATELLCFKDGAEAWCIQYDCNDKTMQPKLVGAVPKVVHKILEDLRVKQQAQDSADYLYELTAEVGLSLVGFRHDTDFQSDDPAPFLHLSKPTKKSRPWWRFWIQ